jgi:3-hydroxyisobutyrate dehydrogenase
VSTTKIATPTVSFLGAGQMGTPMASRLLNAGFNVRAWNRTIARVAPLVDLGATAAATPAEAAQGADVLVTMLPDGPTIESVVGGEDGALAALTHDAVWIQMSTVGAEWADRLKALADSSGVAFVDAPVSGSAPAAQSGQLIILASGPREVRDVAAPVLDAMGRETFWLGDAGAGSRTKLVLNNWLVDLVEMTVENLRFARDLGLDPRRVVEILADAPIGSPYAVAKAASMLDGDFTTNFALKHAVKDASLALDAARDLAHELTLTASFIDSWSDAITKGAGDLDLSSVYAYAAK